MGRELLGIKLGGMGFGEVVREREELKGRGVPPGEKGGGRGEYVGSLWARRGEWRWLG